ncbi:LemA family protein [[Mycobacterium] wendilense]|uniref:LemA family protein n=1 Tax=[Mycobacterium] wendilense TaxID=3064284 RepID=A0ABM9MEP3_9MYCO|nr:LemA family protein [Mycolicibacterium sp. MU0050]CAJ1583368.1 LemA family protein [Mycolicibacterium sp. MU0050]
MVTFVLALALLVALGVLIAFVVGYNRLRAADIRVDEALGGIDVQLTRRAALVPALVSTVSAVAQHEQAIVDRVTAARAALASATTGASVVQRSAAEQQLNIALAQLLELGAGHPQLNSSNNFLHLQRTLADTEDKLAFARQYYNDAVATLNRTLGTIPWMLVAGSAGVTERDYYRSEP